MDMFPDDLTAEKWFESVRWPNDHGITCPHCGSENTGRKENRKPQPFRCRDCRKFFSVRHGSVMSHTLIPLRKWAIAIFLNATNLKGVSSMKLHRDLKITQKTAWFMAHRLREAFASDEGLFVGPVEVDETYSGGKRKNMPKSKRETMTGRGTVGKTVIAGAKDRETNRVVAKTVRGTDTDTLQSFVKDTVAEGADLYTDDHSAYTGIEGYQHESVNHSAGEYVRKTIHTNGIESFWAMLKRGQKGIYHKMSPKHLQRYINEFSGRHNMREGDTIQQLELTVEKMVGKRLTYKRLKADNGLDSGARA